MMGFFSCKIINQPGKHHRASGVAGDADTWSFHILERHLAHGRVLVGSKVGVKCQMPLPLVHTSKYKYRLCPKSIDLAGCWVRCFISILSASGGPTTTGRGRMIASLDRRCRSPLVAVATLLFYESFGGVTVVEVRFFGCRVLRSRIRGGIATGFVIAALMSTADTHHWGLSPENKLCTVTYRAGTSTATKWNMFWIKQEGYWLHFCCVGVGDRACFFFHSRLHSI